MRSIEIFISAAEPSADEHAANLIRAARQLNANVRFTGVTGPAMQSAGCESIFSMSGEAAMLLHAFGAAGRAWKMMKACRQCLKSRHFDAATVMDSPVLHLPLSRVLKKHGIPVLYYIAPQLWAWGAWRIGKLRKRVDKLAVILPFEEQYFRSRGVSTEFVGHPLGDSIALHSSSPQESSQPLIRGNPIIALVPGSRSHVVQQVLPGQLDIAQAIRSRFPDAGFLVSVAHPGVRQLIERILASSEFSQHVSGPDDSEGRLALYSGRLAELVRPCELVLVASGTAALEVALLNKPLVVMYNASRMMHHLIGRWLIRTPYLSLPNILAGRQIVREFMPYYTSTKPIADAAIELLANKNAAKEMREDLAQALGVLARPGASLAAARLLLSLAGAKDGGLGPTHRSAEDSSAQ